MEKFISPAGLARCVPFFLFMALLALRGALPADGSSPVDPRWIYGLCVLVVSGALAYYWRRYQELVRAHWLSLKELLIAAVVGWVVFVLWISLDAPWMMLGEATASFRPVDSEGQLQWGLIAVRWIGASLMVPVMEELFWRSFLMRWIDNPDFETVDPRRTTLKAVVLSTAVFTLAHTQWLAAIVAGLAYAWLYRRTGKLWAPIVAHAVTNGLLGIWVVFHGNWQFW